MGRLSASVGELIEGYGELAQLVRPASIAPVVLADPEDDHVLACAVAAQADLIVSGDSHLLNLKTYQGIPIVNALEALTRLPERRAGSQAGGAARWEARWRGQAAWQGGRKSFA
jgi:hypothetical protein